MEAQFSSQHRITQNYWESLWDNGQTIWHRAGGDQTLRKSLDLLTGGRDHIKILFPLCGKAVDMKWMADLGHQVVGVEFSAKAVQEFFEENGLEYSIENNGQMPVYKTNNNNIRIYQGDLFNFSVTSEQTFDAIWDTGSLVAINKEDRSRYAELMISLMSHAQGGCRYMLKVYEYDDQLFGGPPCCVPEEVVKGLYGGACEIRTLEINDGLELGRKKFCEKFDYFRERVYFLQPKL